MSDQEYNEQASAGPEGQAPDSQQGTPPEQQEGQQQQDHSQSFADGSFDPNALPPELLPVYKQMQAAYTQKTQTVAQQRKEAENALGFINALRSEQDRAAALQELAEFVGYDEYIRAGGFEFEGGEEPPSSQQQPQGDPRVDEVLAWQQQFTAQQQEAQLIQRIEDYTNTEFDRLGVADQDVRELILGRATVYELDDNGMPQIQQATQDVHRLLEQQQKSWLNSKKSPRTPLNGQAGTEEVDFSDSEQRVAYLARALEANSD